MTEPTVLYATMGAVARITLNRPQALNSFTREMHQALWAALDQAEADANIRALVLTGAGRGFCAGADLADFDFTPGPDREARADPGPLIDEMFNPTARRFQALRMPTVAAVNGVAAGAGSSLAMGCDMVVAAPTAGFIQAFSKIGLIPDAGGTFLLVHRLGLARATALAMTGDKLSAAQAKEWGVVWDVAEDCVAAAEALAQRLAAMPTQALVRTRHLLRDAVTSSFEAQLQAERDAQSALAKTMTTLKGSPLFWKNAPRLLKGPDHRQSAHAAGAWAPSQAASAAESRAARRQVVTPSGKASGRRSRRLSRDTRALMRSWVPA